MRVAGSGCDSGGRNTRKKPGPGDRIEVTQRSKLSERADPPRPMHRNAL